jgi:localization factor PodJL
MSGQSPWSVKGVEPRTREAAKDLARREGLTLGELLNRLIAETDEPAPEPAANARSPTSFGQEANRLTAALEHLSRRLEAGGVEMAAHPPISPIGDRLSRKFDVPAASGDTAIGRIETHLNDLRETQAVLSERLRRMESQDPSHASLAALKSLESALMRLSTQVFETDTRVGQIEKLTQEAIQTVDQSLGLVAERLATTEALAQETNHRFAEAMIDLSARLTGLEAEGDKPARPDVSALESRLNQLEHITAQTFEGANQGIDRVTERVNGIEALAQDNASRLVEALVELSARLTQIEGAGKTGDTVTAVDALEAKTVELSARLNDLNAKIEATQALDARLAKVENRESASDQTGSMAMKLELARITRAIDERLSSIERHDASVLEQAGQHIQRLAQNLGDRLDASERQSADSIAKISKQMQELAERLASSTNNETQGFAPSFGGNDDKTQQLLDEALGQVRAEIQLVDARVQAMITPLQRDFVALGDRLDKSEQVAVQAFAEPVYDPNYSADLGDMGRDDARLVNPLDLSQGEGFSFESPLDSLAKPQFDDPFTTETSASKSAAATASLTRRGSFGSPFPNGEGGEFLNDFAEVRDDVTDPLVSGLDPFGIELDPSVPDRATPIDFGSEAGLSSLDNDWDEPNNHTGTGPNYLVTARRAANEAAAAREAAQTKKKPALAPKAPVSNDKKTDEATPSPKLQAPKGGKKADKEAGKSKGPLSPVGIAAAAALVAAGGFAVYSRLQPSSNLDEKPAALNQESVPLPPELASQGAKPVPVEGAVSGSGTQAGEPFSATPATAPPAATTSPVVVRDATPAATTPPSIASPPSQLPKAQLVPPAPKAVTPTVAPIPLKSAPTAQQLEAARIMASADAQARAAKARAQAQRDRLRSATFKADRPDPTPRPVQPATPPRIVTIAKGPTTSSAAPPSVASQAAQASPPNSAAAAPTRLPATPIPAADAPATPAASPPRAAPPGASAALPATRSLLEQAMAREQAGDVAGSIALLRRASDGGDTRAMNRLARKFENGDGVAKDLSQARALTERAAARGSSQAMHNLGVYYANGDGVPQNMVRAAESFRRAAQRGVTDSQFNLGAMAEQGLGGQKSDVQAYYWFALAARSGDQDGANKVREIAARLTPEQRAAQDRLLAQFRPESGSQD